MFEEGLQTPRPRPPALIRRSPSKGTLNEVAPPPPYALEFPSLYEGPDFDSSNPIIATAKMMGIELEEDPELSPTTIEEVSQKSREELTDLFLQAEKIIRAREKELSLAANLGKTLLETNEALKLRHDALLSRLPVMQQPQASSSKAHLPHPHQKSLADSWATDDEMPVPGSTVHSRSSSAASSPTQSRMFSIVDGGRQGHARRLSASPSALMALSETNAELITELTLLRASTHDAQVEGARRLRKLEREIGGLKTELDRTQQTNAELEELVKEQQDEERKKEIQERLKKLRGEVHDVLGQESDEETWDFAPRGQGMEVRDTVGTPRVNRSAPPLQPIVTTFPSDTEQDSEQPPQSAYDASVSSAASSRASSIHSRAPSVFPFDAVPHSRSPSLSLSQYASITPLERAVVAQLYHKVQELQEANTDLRARTRATNERLAKAQHDALQIKKVYEEIGAEIGPASDEDENGITTEEDGEVRGERMKSLGTLKRAWSPDLLGSVRSQRSPRSTRSSMHQRRGSGSRSSDMSPTPKSRTGTGTRELGNKHMSRALKSRKPLTDMLFAPPGKDFLALSPSSSGDASELTERADGETPSIILVPSASASPVRRKSKGKGKPKSRSASRIRSSSPFSAAAFDALGLRRNFSNSSHISTRNGRRTASGSSAVSASSYASLVKRTADRRTLGSELGDEFGADWTPIVARQDTLFSDTSLKGDSDSPGYSEEEVGGGGGGEGGGEEEDGADEGEGEEGEDSALCALRIALNPSNIGRFLEEDEHILPVGALRFSPGEAFQFVAHAVTVRPTRWREGDDRRTRGASHPIFAPIQARQAEDPWETTQYPEIEPGKESESEGSSGPGRSRRREYALERMTAKREIGLAIPSQRSRNALEKLKRTSSDVIVELWITLQFVVVICMFLYTTARRGPREVLGAPPRIRR